MIKDFQILSKLGEGAYSSVYKVKRIVDGQEYALKKVKLKDLNEKEKDNALNEIRILASIRHPNIVCYKEAFFDQGSSCLCIIMEYADNGDLFQKINSAKSRGSFIDEKEIWNVVVQVLRGLKCLHEKKILHRDLKSANVFLSKDGTVKVGDMNVSKIAKKGLLYTQTGTPYYASPEVWNDQPYDSKSDIWSLGCVIYEMVTLKPPFRAEDMDGLYKKVVKGQYSKLPSHYSVDLNNLIKLMLKTKASTRPTCESLMSIPFVQKHLAMMKQSDEPNLQMLQTIRTPQNLHYLTDILPKPNYDPIKSRLTSMVSQSRNRAKEASNMRERSMESQNQNRNRSAMSKNNSVKNNMESLPPVVIKQSHPRLMKPVKSKYSQNRNNANIYNNRSMVHSPQKLNRENEMLNKQHDKIQAQIKRYNEILQVQKQKNHNKIDIKKKIELLIGRDRQDNNKLGNNKYNHMRIHGVGISQPLPHQKNQQSQKGLHVYGSNKNNLYSGIGQQPSASLPRINQRQKMF